MRFTIGILLCLGCTDVFASFRTATENDRVYDSAWSWVSGGREPNFFESNNAHQLGELDCYVEKGKFAQNERIAASFLDSYGFAINPSQQTIEYKYQPDVGDRSIPLLIPEALGEVRDFYNFVNSILRSQGKGTALPLRSARELALSDLAADHESSREILFRLARTIVKLDVLKTSDEVTRVCKKGYQDPFTQLSNAGWRNYAYYTNVLHNSHMHYRLEISEETIELIELPPPSTQTKIKFRLKVSNTESASKDYELLVDSYKLARTDGIQFTISVREWNTVFDLIIQLDQTTQEATFYLGDRRHYHEEMGLWTYTGRYIPYEPIATIPVCEANLEDNKSDILKVESEECK